MTRVAGLAVLFAGCALRPAAAPAPTPTISIATYNLNYALAGDASTEAALAALGAEVLVLQEVGPAWETRLRVLRGRYPYACRVRSSYPAGGGAILSRLPLSDCASSASETGWFPALAATIASEVGPVRVVNLHLQPARGGVSAIADVARLGPRHRAEVSRHLERLAVPATPTLLAGDLNESDGEGALHELAARGFRSALAERSPSAVTWRWPVGAMHLEKRLDHVLYPGHALRCVDARVLHEGRSDHFPVVARFAAAAAPRAMLGASLAAGRASTLTPR